MMLTSATMSVLNMFAKCDYTKYNTDIFKGKAPTPTAIF